MGQRLYLMCASYRLTALQIRAKKKLTAAREIAEQPQIRLRIRRALTELFRSNPSASAQSRLCGPPNHI